MENNRLPLVPDIENVIFEDIIKEYFENCSTFEQYFKAGENINKVLLVNKYFKKLINRVKTRIKAKQAKFVCAGIDFKLTLALLIYNKKVAPECFSRLKKEDAIGNFIYAVEYGHHQMVKVLLLNCKELVLKCIKLNPTSFESIRASNLLMLAAFCQHKELVEFLIEANFVDINAKNGNNLTALMGAVDKDIVKILIKNGADVNAKAHSGCTALHFAGCMPFSGDDSYYRIHLESIVDQLLANGANINEPDNYGSTPLMLAISNGQTEMFKILIDRSADIHLKNEEGETALSKAIEIGCKEFVKVLIGKAAEVNSKNKYGCSLLSQSIIMLPSDKSNCESKDRLEIIMMLIDSKAKLDLAGADFFHLRYAISRGYTELNKLLNLET